MSVSLQAQTPYNITMRVWRDEQPGDEPTLHLAAVFVPFDVASAWREPRLQHVELSAAGRRWTPRESTLSGLDEGAFELRAQGEATLPAGETVIGAGTMLTASGPRNFSLPATRIARVD